MNWNIREKVALIQGVTDRQRFVLGKLPFGVTPSDRSEKWDEITGTMNSYINK